MVKWGQWGQWIHRPQKIQKRCAMKELIRRIRYKVINILLDEENLLKKVLK